MRRIEPYPQKEREQIIKQYQQSGLSPYSFCKRSEIAVSETTLKRWLNSSSANPPIPIGSGPSIESEQLGMVCYTIAASTSDEEERTPDHHHRLSLQEMVTFHNRVYECCCTLNELACTAENAITLKYIMEVL